MVKMMNTQLQEAAPLSNAESFLKSLSLLEQAHRRLHDVVKDDLERGGERSLTGVQALLLYEIGEGETRDIALPPDEFNRLAGSVKEHLDSSATQGLYAAVATSAMLAHNQYQRRRIACLLAFGETIRLILPRTGRPVRFVRAARVKNVGFSWSSANASAAPAPIEKSSTATIMSALFGLTGAGCA